jgi:ABC-2 type transport system ATP-binding protein
MPIITTNKLTKHYRVHQKNPGFFGSIQGLVKRNYKTVEAVKEISLSIQEGELIGFIGPNGAGKTTTLKMLSGLLHPSGGSAQVMGYVPWERPKDFLKQFSIVMGQKAQLWWDLPLYDSLLLQRDIYEIDQIVFQKNLDEMISLLDLSSFLKIQVRKLSLGQRMRGELAAALIYHPRVLFLDEPTIGLDVVVQKKVRDFIRTYRQRHGGTIILTSHYLEDVRELCESVVIIDHGVIAYDGSTQDLINQYVDHKQIVLTLSRPVKRSDLEKYGQIVSYRDSKATIQVNRTDTAKQASAALAGLPATDISIKDPSLEDVVQELFTGQDTA